MDNEILKDIAFCEAINDKAKRDPLMERAVSNKKPLADYVINVLIFESMTAEEFFTAAPYQAHAAQIREMRESYESLGSEEKSRQEDKNELAETVAELKKTIKALTENKVEEPTVDTLPADETIAGDSTEHDEDEDNNNESKSDPKTEE